MEAHEKETVLAHLENGRRSLLDALSGVTEDVAAKKPAPGKWSVLECVEHLAISEEYLFSQMSASWPADGAVANRDREALLLSRGADRTRPRQSPEALRSAGRFPTLRDALRHFLAARERTVQFVENCGDDLRSRLTSHPVIGTVNCYENLLMIAMHPQRHAKQIEETKTALASPV
jgi:hypothetical protein